MKQRTFEAIGGGAPPAASLQARAAVLAEHTALHTAAEAQHGIAFTAMQTAAEAQHGIAFTELQTAS